MFDIIFSFEIRISHFESAVNSGLLTIEKKTTENSTKS